MRNKKDKSIFNKYLDEILYFFEVNNYNIVIFEDLDRFKNPEIFVKLRELNFLINNYEKVDRKVVFIYAIKDDVFLSKERTKFFYFIIPVIPYLNSTNSYEILRKASDDYDCCRNYGNFSFCNLCPVFPGAIRRNCRLPASVDRCPDGSGCIFFQTKAQRAVFHRQKDGASLRRQRYLSCPAFCTLV
mgnify:CR=1 FL=1